jgi:hypothetical protein
MVGMHFVRLAWPLSQAPYAISKHLKELIGFERFYTTLIFRSLNDAFQQQSVERYH